MVKTHIIVSVNIFKNGVKIYNYKEKLKRPRKNNMNTISENLAAKIILFRKI